MSMGDPRVGGTCGIPVCVHGTAWLPHSPGKSTNGYSTPKVYHRSPDQSRSLVLDVLSPGPLAHFYPLFLLQTSRLSYQVSLPPTPISRQGLWRGRVSPGSHYLQPAYRIFL